MSSTYSSTALLLVLVTFNACKRSEVKESYADTTLKYAKGFSIKESEGYTEVEVNEPYHNATTSFKYLFVPKGNPIPSHSDGVQVIFTPITTLVCTSTSHIALLDLLQETNKLIGFPSTDLVSSTSARLRIDSGYVTDLGIDTEMNLELLASIGPDMVMGYSINGDMLKLNKIKEFGIPVVVNGEYLEEHPLGRAEWIKFMGLFFEKEEMADSIFNYVERQYNESRALAEQVDMKPTVISGILYGDSWFLPGGQNYAAKMFRDAGYNYLWSENSSSGFLQLSFESVFAVGKEADFWIGVGSFGSMNELKNTEQRYTLFKAYRESAIYSYDARKGAKGGSEYLELGYSRPDIVLKDLIKITHPELLPDYELFFYKKLY